MRFDPANSNSACPRTDIAAYLDGDLDNSAEIELELHFAGCPQCRDEVNAQKRLMFALDGALDPSAEIELPSDFAKVVAANAESRVEGLRCPVERSRAMMVCALLGILVLFGLGADSAAGSGVAGLAFDRIGAVALYFGHLVMDLGVAVSVILRSVCLQVVYRSAVSGGVLLAAGVLSAIFVSRILKHYRL